MAAHHDALLERAARELGIGEQLEFRFDSVEQAHKEYINLSRAQKKKGGSNVMRSITLKRSQNCVYITLDTPPHFWPAPTVIKANGERIAGKSAYFPVKESFGSRETEDEGSSSCTSQGETGYDLEELKRRARQDVIDGIITQEEYDDSFDKES